MLDVIVTADDLGISRGITRGILTAHDLGVVTAASVMANGTALDAVIDEVTARPSLALGAHLVFVGEDRPLLTHREVPTLVDRSGALPRSWRHLAARVLSGRVSPDDLRAEGRAQLERLRDGLGLDLSHVNTHQHVHLLPAVARVVVDLAVEAGVGYLRAPTTSSRSPRAVVIRRWRRQLVDAAGRAGLATSDTFAGLDEAGHLTAADVVAAVARSGPGVLEVNCHPGLPTPADRLLYRWGYAWEREVRALTDRDLARALTGRGVRLVRPGEAHAGHRTSGENRDPRPT
ncbi:MULTISPECIES: carbohydrate deacetylase [unclassified Isoptericola]|uniref:carbohydrate deacetylase n=1 Tax=unclassified Isoptericola TaxID=2623355 RepID=UPI0027137467|nr:MULTISPECIES: ChbG/HpnK family deacetylase [unclassified Isoptericola]MDO8143845.1 ChbG/HpnK family deacetylase [Isoptericola sp. 178]MDO8147740.1 ChbG/HpnK family deacetylase [Isoptericola sp. b515]